MLPAWVVLRVSAEWIADKEGWNDVDDPPDWIGIGYIAGDAGLLLIVVSGLLGWFALRRARGDGDRPATGGARRRRPDRAPPGPQPGRPLGDDDEAWIGLGPGRGEIRLDGREILM